MLLRYQRAIIDSHPMGKTLDMLNSLSSGEVKSIIPFIIEEKDYINEFKLNTNKSISDSIKLVIN